MFVTFLFFLPIVRYSVESIKVFEFSDENDETSISTVSIDVPLQNADNFTICLSYKRYQLNIRTRTLFTFFEDKDQTTPWFSVSFWFNNAKTEEMLWGELKMLEWFIMGSIPVNSSGSWINFCTNIDFIKKKIVSSINGLEEVEYNVTNNDLSRLPLLYLRFGVSKEENFASTDNDKQFIGSGSYPHQKKLFKLFDIHFFKAEISVIF